MNTISAVLNEVKKAISGKDQVRCDMTAFLAKGHILWRTCPRGKTTARWPFPRRDLSYGRVHSPRRPALRKSRLVPLPKETGAMQYQPARSSATCSLRTSSTAPPPAPNPPFWRPWRRGRSPWTVCPIRCRSRFSLLRPRTPPAPQARSCCPIPRSTALPSGSPSAIRRRRRNGRWCRIALKREPHGHVRRVMSARSSSPCAGGLRRIREG